MWKLKIKWWLLFAAEIGTLAYFIAVAPFEWQHANARWKPEYAQLPQATRDWFNNAELTPSARERLGFKFCCKESERVKTKFKVNATTHGDEWFYLNEKSGRYEKIPDDIIHWGESGPNGEAILFALDQVIRGQPIGTLTCFFPPQSGQ